MTTVRGAKNDDSYEDGDPEGPHPCDCWYSSSISLEGWGG